MMNRLKRSLRFDSRLVRGRKEEEKKRIEESFNAAPTYLKALADRLESKVEESVMNAESMNQYLAPNWALRQSDSRGYRRALREVLSTFTEYK